MDVLLLYYVTHKLKHYEPGCVVTGSSNKSPPRMACSLWSPCGLLSPTNRFFQLSRLHPIPTISSYDIYNRLKLNIFIANRAVCAHGRICATHVSRFSERPELLLFQRESAERQRRVLVILQLGLHLLNLLVTLWVKGQQRQEERGEKSGTWVTVHNSKSQRKERKWTWRLLRPLLLVPYLLCCYVWLWCWEEVRTNTNWEEEVRLGSFHRVHFESKSEKLQQIWTKMKKNPRVQIKKRYTACFPCWR